MGKGYWLDTYAGLCDGSVDSFCKHQEDQDCLLYNHNDGRNGILMDAYSGWMVTNLPEFKVRLKESVYFCLQYFVPIHREYLKALVFNLKSVRIHSMALLLLR